LDHADGDAVIFLDADMQDPPECMPELIEKWRGGAKLVVGCRKSRAERGVRGLLMNGFHEVFFRMTRGAMPKNSGTFGLMDRLIADQVRALPERNLFLPALRKWVGFKQDVVWYDRKARIGQAKQTYAKLFRYAWDGITSFSETPLQVISALGALLCLVGFGYAGFLVGIKLLQVFGYFHELKVQGFTTLALAVVGLGGIQLLCLGIIGQYLARVYTEVKARPHYIVENLQTTGGKKYES
jgi:dolichol-phosphate mannosyltransferase